MQGATKKGRPDEDPRLRQQKADAARPMSVNLAETISLSHKLFKISGSARRG